MSLLHASVRLRSHIFLSSASNHMLSHTKRYSIVNSVNNNTLRNASFIANTTMRKVLLPRFRSMTSLIPRQTSHFLRNMSRISRRNGSSSRSRLQNLESEANANPDSASAQYAYIRELGRQHPEEVINRCESGIFASNMRISQEYAAALRRVSDSSSGKKSLGSIFGTRAAGTKVRAEDSGMRRNFQGRNSGVQGNMKGMSPQEPLHVQISQAGTKEKFFWSALKSSLLIFLGISFIGVAMEDKLSPGGALKGMTKDVKPQEDIDVSFMDVKGVDEAKEELQEVVEFLKEPQRFTRLGGKLPKGVLLTGPPGTGKTLLAKAVAGEAGVPFFYMSGSEFEEVFVGVGARRVRDLFKSAKISAPCIIFIDEIDAIGCKRSERQNVSTKATLNQLLVEMDGFKSQEGVIVVAATNFPEILDPALLRPGRFDRKVQVGLPDRNGRREIIDLYLNSVRASSDCCSIDIAKGTPGASGADLFNLVNEASLKASIDRREEVTHKDLQWAKDKIQMGKESKSRILTPDDMRCTAFHEAGHALVALLTPGADKVEKATIMPRGRALGMVLTLPSSSEVSTTKKRLLAKMDVAMGGRIAEEITFGPDEITTGASSDMQQATNIARHMVTECGFGAWSPDNDSVTNNGQGESSDVDDETEKTFGLLYAPDMKKLSGSSQVLAEKEMRELLRASYNRAKAMLMKHKKQHKWIAEALLEHETLTGEELMQVFNGMKVKREE